MVITISTSWSTSYQAFFKGSISVSSARSRRHATGRNCRNWRRIAEIGGELPKLEAFRTLRKRKRPSNPNVKGSRLIEVYRQRRSELGSMPAGRRLRGEPDVVMQGDRAVQQSRWSTSRGGQSGASAIYGKNSLLMNGRGCAL